MQKGHLLTAMITPFNQDLEVDYSQAERIAEHLIKTGTEGIVIAGTTGESPTLTDKEKDQLLRVIKKTIGNRADIIMGAGSNNTRETIEAVKKAEAAGADGVMLVTPYYNKPSQEGLYEHFSLAAESSSLPVILYNIPGRTGCSLAAQTIGKLAEIKQIAAVKEASGCLSQVTEIRTNTPEDFIIYSGDDAMTLPMLSIGGHGIISVASHVAGRQITEMLAAWNHNDTELAAELHTKLYPLFKALFIAPNPAPVKYAMTRYGFDTNRVRLPLVVVNEAEKIKIDQVLDSM